MAFVYYIKAGVPFYLLTKSVASVDEGSQIAITLTTQYVPNGTVVPFAVTGIQQGDIDSNSLVGEFTVMNNSATVTFTVTADQLTEGSETVTVALTSVGQSITFNINDTSTANQNWIIEGGDNTWTAASYDQLGNAYLTGTRSSGGTIAKLSGSGEVVWANEFSTVGGGSATGVVVGAENDVYYCGQTIGDQNSTGWANAVVSKFDATTGGAIWTKGLKTSPYPGGGQQTAARSIVLGTNCVYVAYSRSDAAHVKIVKFDTSGNVVWNKQFDFGTTYDTPVLTFNGTNLYVLCTSSANSGNCAVMSLSEDGTGAAVCSYGTTTSETIGSLAVDGSGNVVVVGTSRTGGTADIFVIKATLGGSMLWQRRYHQTGTTENGTAVAIDNSNNIYVGGSSSNSIPSGVLYKVSADGTTLWRRDIGPSTYSTVKAVVALGENITIVGSQINANLPADGSKTGTYGNIQYVSSTVPTIVTTGIVAYTASISSYPITATTDTAVFNYSALWAAIAFSKNIIGSEVSVSGVGTYGVTFESTTGISYLSGYLTASGIGAIVARDVELGTITRVTTESASQGIWAKAQGDSNGNVFAVGNFYKSSTTNKQAWVAKYSSSGTRSWLKEIGHQTVSFVENFTDIVISQANTDIGYVAGSGFFDGGGGKSVLGQINLTTGAVNWIYAVGAPGASTSETPYGLCTDAAGSVYAGLLGSASPSVIKLTNSGTVAWSKQLPLPTNSGRVVRTVEESGMLYVVGYTNVATSSINNIFVVCLDSSTGAKVWGKSYAKGSNDSNNIQIFNNEIVVGMSRCTLHIDKTTGELNTTKMFPAPMGVYKKNGWVYGAQGTTIRKMSEQNYNSLPTMHIDQTDITGSTTNAGFTATAAVYGVVNPTSNTGSVALGFVSSSVYDGVGTTTHSLG